MATVYKVIWDNGHASGSLSGAWEDEKKAESAGEDWHAEMVAADPDPEAAIEIYSYEVTEMEVEPCACGNVVCSHCGPTCPSCKARPDTDGPTAGCQDLCSWPRGSRNETGHNF